MTPAEIMLKATQGRALSPDALAAVSRAIEIALAEEREACAKEADEGIGWPGEAPAAARCIAANIRARGSK